MRLHWEKWKRCEFIWGRHLRTSFWFYSVSDFQWRMAEIRILYTRGKTTKNEFIKTDYRKDRYMHSAKFGLKAIMHKTKWVAPEEMWN